MKIVEITQTHTMILQKLDELQEIQNQTHANYKGYIEKNKTNKVFGLDSFYYQSRLFDLEIKHAKDHYAFVNNRIYCDYYKLHGMVKTFYKDNFKLEPKKKNYIPYKDLEPFKIYDFMDSMILNQDIKEMIQKSLEIIQNMDDEISVGPILHRMNIDNFILNHRYNISALKTKVELYEKYLHSYHIYHMSFLSNLFEKLSLMFRQNTPPSDIETLENLNISHEVISNEVISNEVMNSLVKTPPEEVPNITTVNVRPDQGFSKESLTSSVVITLGPSMTMSEHLPHVFVDVPLEAPSQVLGQIHIEMKEEVEVKELKVEAVEVQDEVKEETLHAEVQSELKEEVKAEVQSEVKVEAEVKEKSKKKSKKSKK